MLIKTGIMKKWYVITGLIFFLAACGTNSSDNNAEINDSTDLRQSWQASYIDSTGGYRMEATGTPLPDSLSLPGIIALLNNNYPRVQLSLLKTSADTLYVSIPDASYLTQQMGSTGPEMYFAEAVFNLTEFPGIRFVHFDFEAGDHAGPDTYSRESFKQ